MEHRAGDFRIYTTVDGAAARLAVIGEIDLATGPLLDAGLAEAAAGGTTEVVVDLSGLEFLDSSGLGVLITHHKLLREAGRRLVILSPSPPAERVLAISGLDRVLEIRTAAGLGVRDGVAGMAEAGRRETAGVEQAVVESRARPSQPGSAPGDRQVATP